MARLEAANFISGQESGAYFIHQSPSDETSFYLTVCDVGDSAQYKIKYSDGRFALGPQTFASLGDVRDVAQKQGLRGKKGHYNLCAPCATKLQRGSAADGIALGDVSSSGGIAMQATLADTDSPVRVASKQRPSLVDGTPADMRAAKQRKAKDRLKHLGARMGAKFTSVRNRLAKHAEDGPAAVPGSTRVTAPPTFDANFEAMPLPLSLTRQAPAAGGVAAGQSGPAAAAASRTSDPHLGRTTAAGSSAAPLTLQRDSDDSDDYSPPPPVAPRASAARHDSMARIHAKEAEAKELAEVGPWIFNCWIH